LVDERLTCITNKKVKRRSYLHTRERTNVYFHMRQLILTVTMRWIKTTILFWSQKLSRIQFITTATLTPISSEVIG